VVNEKEGALETRLQRQGSTVTLSLSGDLVLNSVAKFHAALEEIGSEPLDLLVIDLRRLEFIDSSGLRAIVASEGQALGHGYALQIVRGSEQVDEVFRVTGLDSTLPLVEAPNGSPESP
jgi:anti-sigma B factor antagonist